MNSPLESLAASLYHALERLNPTKLQNGREIIPKVYDCSVTMFEQSWGSTCLGFPGIGGQSFTSAYTVIVEGPNGDYCVYFGGRFAYHTENPSEKFFQDRANQSMAEVGKHFDYQRRGSPRAREPSGEPHEKHHL